MSLCQLDVIQGFYTGTNFAERTSKITVVNFFMQVDAFFAQKMTMSSTLQELGLNRPYGNKLSGTRPHTCNRIFSIAGKPTGLISLLDEECNFPAASDDTLLQKFNQQHKNSEYYEMPPHKASTFIIRHYAGSVKYSIKVRVSFNYR